MAGGGVGTGDCDKKYVSNVSKMRGYKNNRVFV